MKKYDRRSVLTGLGSVGASLWPPPSADGLGLADDKIKVVRYFSNSGFDERRDDRNRTWPHRHRRKCPCGNCSAANRAIISSGYATAFPRGPNGTLEDAARACMDAGFRCYRHATDNPRERLVDRFKLVRQMHEDCIALHKITGDGGWAIDFHTELDPPDAINLATLLEPLHPYFCEDLIRSEGVDSYATMRERTRVPIAVGEQFGYKWDINTLIERQLIDYARVTLPNAGGITELMKIIALAETH